MDVCGIAFVENFGDLRVHYKKHKDIYKDILKFVYSAILLLICIRISNTKLIFTYAIVYNIETKDMSSIDNQWTNAIV